jgi:putative membrane protein
MMGTFGMGGAWLFWLLIAVGAVLIVVLIVRLAGAGRGRAASQPTETGGRSVALRLLDERYARGELTSEEYQERVRTLGEEHR